MQEKRNLATRRLWRTKGSSMIKKRDDTIPIEIDVANLNSKKHQLEMAIAEYVKEADKYALEAKKENLELFETFKQFKACIKRKQEELDEFLKKKQKLMF